MTVYDGTGAAQSLTVSIPAGVEGPANPMGEVYNATADFVMSTAAGSTPARFFVAAEGGTIAAWSATVSGTTVIFERSPWRAGSAIRRTRLALRRSEFKC